MLHGDPLSPHATRCYVLKFTLRHDHRESRYKPPKAFGGKVRQNRLSKVTYRLFDLTYGSKDFLVMILALTLVSVVLAPYKTGAMWFGFALASYSAIANDSIQTVGTFIASNTHRSWWHLWLFMGLIFVATTLYSWTSYQGDVSHQRLTSSGFEQAPQSFSFLQLSAPIVLLVLTRLRIPVSTTFLLLNVFTTKAHAVFHIFYKSVSGYFISFFLAIGIWYLTSTFGDPYFKKKKVGVGWVLTQWCTSGMLWSAWLMQDASNIAVFLPRQLHIGQLCIFIGLIFSGLGLLFYLRGDRMQEIISEKANIKDIRAATLVDMVYMSILIYFKNLNQLPMSTTWIFIGLLGGRELAIGISKKNKLKRKKAIRKGLKFIRKDLVHACIGLVVAMIWAIIANPVIRQSAMQCFGYYVK